MKLYRYSSRWKISFWRDLETVDVWCDEYEVIKETRCGYWIADYPQKDPDKAIKDKWTWTKWVSKGGKKRYAYPTKEEALESFIIRKHRQVGHARRHLDFAEKSLKQAEHLEKTLHNEEQA